MPDVVRSWRFASSSGSKTYETLQWDNGDVTCNCPGWTFKRQGQGRGCKHTRSVHAGTADSECIHGSSLDVARGINVHNKTSTRVVGKVESDSFKKQREKVKIREKMPARKISW